MPEAYRACELNDNNTPEEIVECYEKLYEAVMEVTIRHFPHKTRKQHNSDELIIVAEQKHTLRMEAYKK